LEAVEKETTFEDALINFIKDTNSACEILNEYVGGDRLIDDFKEHEKSQEKLFKAFKDEIKKVEFDKRLINVKIPKANLKNIDTQNEQIQSLCFTMLNMNVILSIMDEKNVEYQEALSQYNRLNENIGILEEKILVYNGVAKKSHNSELLTIEKARLNAVNALKNYINENRN